MPSIYYRSPIKEPKVDIPPYLTLLNTWIILWHHWIPFVNVGFGSEAVARYSILGIHTIVYLVRSNSTTEVSFHRGKIFNGDSEGFN